jgi:energy-coupling factor transporter ATP-binding protein EcfA2
MATLQSFHSLLYPSAEQELAQTKHDLHDAFHDLCLEPIFAVAFGAFLPSEKPSLYIATRADEDATYRAEVLKELRALFASPLVNLDVVYYRQDALRDMQQAPVLQALKTFQHILHGMRDQLHRAAKVRNVIEGQRWFVDAVIAYGQALDVLDQALEEADLQSQAMLALRQYLAVLLASDAHTARMTEAQALIAGLAQVRYAVRIDGSTVSVLQNPDDPDYTAIIVETFARFRQKEGKDYRAQFAPASELNHVEGQILDRVALLYPELFDRLARFCKAQNDFADACILRLDRDLAWFLSWVDFTQRFVTAGLPLCFPTLNADSGHLDAHDAYDMALAQQYVEAQQPAVCNDFTLLDEERMLVITGANHGGKTTLARTIGQLHHIAALGLPVAARSASLLLCDRLFTHFERVEDINNQRGKLQDDLVRMHRILASATPQSLVLMNEIFSSTTLDDALWLARRIMERLSTIGATCVFVTFLDELSTFDAHTVSMVASVDTQDPTMRTFKLVRRPADYQSYALALARKYGVTRDQLLQKIAT